jgi:hypothetical protein
MYVVRQKKFSFQKVLDYSTASCNKVETSSHLVFTITKLISFKLSKHNPISWRNFAFLSFKLNNPSIITKFLYRT